MCLLLARAVVCGNCTAGRKITAGEELMGDWQCVNCNAVNYGDPSFGFE
jgi:hypothetical protein